MRLRDYPFLSEYSLKCHNCGSTRLEILKWWLSEGWHSQIPDGTHLECKECCISICPEEDLKKKRKYSKKMLEVSQ